MSEGEIASSNSLSTAAAVVCNLKSEHHQHALIIRHFVNSLCIFSSFFFFFYIYLLPLTVHVYVCVPAVPHDFNKVLDKTI